MRHLLSRRSLLVALALLASGGAGRGDSAILSAPDAYALLTEGKIVMLDIRRPREWAQTGVAQGAWPVSMHDKAFAQRLQAILSQYPADRIALICATGGRSKHVADWLAENRITGVRDVSEGMMGNRRGPGWIARGLPLVSRKEALAAFAPKARELGIE